jgi:fucose permease
VRPRPLIGIVLAALCVGGTFMVVTMAGLQEARSVAGSNARALMGAMTACFGLGQIAGPLLVSSLASLPNGSAWALVASAAPLLAASYSLHRQRARPLVAQSG